MRLAILLLVAGCACAGAPPHQPAPDARPAPVTAIDAAPPEVVEGGEPVKVLQVNETGELIDLADFFVPGYVTIVDFWATWCGACKTMEEEFMKRIKDEPRILVRKVDVGDGDTPVAEHYDIGPLPHIRVYDTKGELKFILMSNNALDAGQRAIEVLKLDQAAAE